MKSQPLEKTFLNFKSLADIIHSPFCIVKKSDRSLQFANASWIDLMEVTPDEFGRSLAEIWPELFTEITELDTKTSHLDKIFHTLQGLTQTPRKSKTERPNTRAFDVTIKPLSLLDKCDYLCIQTSIHNQFSKDLKKLNDEKTLVESANRQKDLFIASLSHELRNTLGVILGFTDLLRDNYREDLETREMFDVVSRSAENMTRLLEDLMDTSSIESGHFKISPTEFSIHQLLEETASFFRDKVERKGLQFDVSLSPTLPSRLINDVNRLRQILVNIIGNAIKFTHEGNIRVHVSLETKDNRSWLNVLVSDTGVGMTEEQAQQLFEAYSRGENSRNVNGIGLGLSLSRNLAKAMGGDIKIIECHPNFGSKFLITVAVEVPSVTPVSLGNPTFQKPYYIH